MRDAIDGALGGRARLAACRRGHEPDHGPRRPFDAQHAMVAHDRARPPAPGPGPARRSSWQRRRRRRAARRSSTGWRPSAALGWIRRGVRRRRANDPSPDDEPVTAGVGAAPRAGAPPRARRAGAADAPAVGHAVAAGDPLTSRCGGPAPAAGAPPAAASTIPRAPRPRAIAEPDDPDRAEIPGDAEPIEELALTVGDAEEPAAEPSSTAASRIEHRGHRRVDLPESHRPVRLLVHAEVDLVGLRVALEVPTRIGEREDQHGGPVRDGLLLPTELGVAGRLPERRDRLRGVEHEELEPLREPRRGGATPHVDDAIDRRRAGPAAGRSAAPSADAAARLGIPPVERTDPDRRVA